MAGDEPTEGLSPDLMGELLQEMQAVEADSQESTLKSLDSLESWMSNHPALRQMLVVEKFSEVGPAILSFLRLMLGYKTDEPDDTVTEAAPNEPGHPQ